MCKKGFPRFLYAAVPAACVLLTPAAAQAIKEVDPAPQFPSVTLVAGQNVRVNLANFAIGPDYRPGSCRVAVTFIDGAGRAVDNPDFLELRPGVSVTVMGPSPHMRDGALQLRAVVDVLDDSAGASGDDCRVVPLMEVFSEETGATLFLNHPVRKEFNPQPSPTENDPPIGG